MLKFPTHRRSLKTNRSHKEADICEERNFSQFHSVNFERVFNFWLRTCSYRSKEKICDGACILD